MKPLAANTMIQGRYLVVHLIGKGGMGEVYLAVDQRLGSAVALKRTSFADDQMLAAAFEREAKILARLRHPVLPKVSDHFSENGEQYLVMEHISGDDLSKRIEAANKAFPVSWVMFWADQLLDALSYLHSHEPPIIHRDIKPQNLKLTDENHIILLDFGLSKDTANRSVVSEPGKSGSVVGYTPHFAPMEQIRGTGTNPRSDIYSLSATLYQLMTNTVPADALTRADAMLSSQNDPIRPLSAINPEISPAVSNVILKGLEVSQERRFSTAGEMQKSLRAAYAQMQGQMSADTVAFNIADQAGADLHHTSPPIDPGRAVAPSEMPTVTPPAAETVQDSSASMEATIRMAAPQAEEALRQADVKTAVFLSADLAKEPETPTPPASPLAAETPQPVAESPVIPQVSQGSEAPESSEPAATMPLIDIPENDPARADVPASPEFFHTVMDAAPAAAPTPAAEPEQARSQLQSQSQVSQPQASQTPPPPAKKKSKAILILALLALFFLVIVAVAGGGWYYYANYYVGGTKAKPSPTPSATSTPTPEASPSPTVESTPSTNSNSSATDTNSNSSSNDPTVSPTQTPTTGTITTKPTPQVLPTKTQTTVTKPTPGTKPTPKAKPSNDRTVIDQ